MAMKIHGIASTRKKHGFFQYLLLVTLTVTSLVALWHRRRARQCTDERHLPEKVSLPPSVPHVSIILPVRNEAANIDACLASLVAQDYPDFSITVIDDGSTDATPALLAAWCARVVRIRVYRVEQLPPGWAGKTYALHTGVKQTQGEWLLFTDADTQHEPSTLRIMMGHALYRRNDLLSMGMNIMTLSGPATPLLIPVTEILLAQRVTPAIVKNPSSRRAFAFGQYILLRREAYLSTQGYNTLDMRTCAVEDLALAEQIKQSGGSVEIVDGRGLVNNRQWTTWNSARQGWGKSCYSEIIRSHIPLGGFPAALALIIYGLGPLSCVLSASATRKVFRLPFWLASLTLLAQIDAKRRIDKKYGLAWYWALTAPIAWVVGGCMALDVTRQILTRQRTIWKGRQIPQQKHNLLWKTRERPYKALFDFRGNQPQKSGYGKCISPGNSCLGTEDTA